MNLPKIFLLLFFCFSLKAEEKTIEYQKLETNSSYDMFFSQGVNMENDGSKMSANEVAVLDSKNKDTQIISAFGNVQMDDGGQKIHANKIKIYNQDKSMFSSNIFFRDKEVPVSIFAKSFESKDDIKIIKNVRITGCFKKEGKEIKNIKQCFLDENFNKNSENNISKEYRWTPWSINASEARINTTTQWATLKHMNFKVFGVPVFYLPYTRFPFGPIKEGAHGLLPIRPIMLGTRQQGLEVPLYFRPSNNTDILFTSHLYTSIPYLSTEKTPSSNPLLNTKDSERKRETHFSVTLRHLINNPFEKTKPSFVIFDGMITDRTRTITENRVASIDSSGRYNHSNRGYYDVKGSVWLSKNTSFKFNFMDVSDPNFLFIYKNSFKNSTRNNATLQRITDESYNSIEVNQFKPLFVYFNTNTTPLVTMARSSFRKKIGDTKGYFEFNNSFTNFSSQSSYTENKKITEGVFYMPKIFSNGTKVSLQSKLRLDLYAYDNTKSSLNAISPGTVGTSYLSSDVTNFAFGNYDYMISQNSYSAGRPSHFYKRLNSSTNVTAEHPFIKRFSGSNFIINPKFSISHNTGSYGFTNITNQDSLDSRLSYSNLFSGGIGKGYDLINLGTIATAGLDFAYKTDSGYKFSLFTGQAYRLYSENSYLNTVAASSGFSKNVSDYVSRVAARTPFGLTANSYFRISQSSGNVLESSSNIGYSNKSAFLGLSYMTLNKDASFVGQDIDFLGLNARLKIWRLSLMYAEMFNLSKTKGIDGYSIYGSMMRTVGAIYDGGCVDYGVYMSQMSLAGVSNITTIKFTFNIKMYD